MIAVLVVAGLVAAGWLFHLLNNRVQARHHNLTLFH